MSVVSLLCYNMFSRSKILNSVCKNLSPDSNIVGRVYKNQERTYSVSNKSDLKESANSQSYFGFEKVSTELKSQKIQSVFSNVASSYDLMNDIMSCGIHRLWKDYLIHILNPLPSTKLLDVACGTGDISFRFLKTIDTHIDNPNDKILSPLDENAQVDSNLDENDRLKVVMLDINHEMLTVCKNRAKTLGFNKGFTCLQGDAAKLPLPSSTFDAYTIAFGIRNVVHIEQALREAYRVLKPGGRFLCLEFSQVTNPIVARFYDLYSFQVIPVMGQLIAGDWNSYQYLVESIKKFPDQDEFSCMIEEAGFSMVSFENLLNGIASIHSGYKI